MRIAATLTLITCLLSAPVRAETESIVVHGTAEHTCAAYFHFAGTAPHWPMLLSLRGTGIYSTATWDRLDPAERALVAAGRVTLVTLDKPGISPAATPGTVRINDKQYNATDRGIHVAVFKLGQKYQEAKKQR